MLKIRTDEWSSVFMMQKILIPNLLKPLTSKIDTNTYLLIAQVSMCTVR